jgi:hypothetical protein
MNKINNKKINNNSIRTSIKNILNEIRKHYIIQNRFRQDEKYTKSVNTLYKEYITSYSKILGESTNTKYIVNHFRQNGFDINKLSKTELKQIEEETKKLFKKIKNLNKINNPVPDYMSMLKIEPNPESNSTNLLSSGIFNGYDNIIKKVDDFWDSKRTIGDGSCLFHAIIGYYRHMEWPLNFDDNSDTSFSLRNSTNKDLNIIAEMGFKLRRDVTKYVEDTKRRGQKNTFNLTIPSNEGYIKFTNNNISINGVIQILSDPTSFAGDTELPYIASKLKKNIILLTKASHSRTENHKTYTNLQIYVFEKPLTKDNCIFLLQKGKLEQRHFETLIPNEEYRLIDVFYEFEDVEPENKFIITMDNSNVSKNKGSYVYFENAFLEHI